MNRRQLSNKNNIIKSFKDYLAPIIIISVILLFVINSLVSKEDTTKIDNNSSSKLEVTLQSPTTEGYIEYSGGKKTKIEGQTSLYKSEKIQVVSDSIGLKNDLVKFNLNKLGELKYNEDGSYTLYSSDLWVEALSNITIEMRYAKVLASQNSVFSLSQNEVASTIYVVSGNVEVKNLAGNSTVIKKGEKLVIMRNDSNDKNKDLSLSKELIDDYIKNEDFFIKNNGSFYLSQIEDNTSTGETSTGTSNNISSSNNGSYISFNNLYDEAEVTGDKIDISGSLLNDGIKAIEIDGKSADINSEAKTFIVKNVNISNKTNDIVYKIYDTNSKIVDKGVLTLFNIKGVSGQTPSGTTGLAGVENYPITTSPLYQIVSPKQNPYTTTENVVRIEGTIPARTVSKIFVNDFQLQKFVKNSSYWQYFANSDFGNLKPGVNIYKIQFYGEGDKVIYETNFTIIKQEEPKKEEVKEENKIN
ncbi:hypothetical protein H3C61_00115 [Candidatus Gracilibacteria bacterium]|nr:hypothetical protein [Candidatus Gracilibacteria bacterium]